MQKDFRFKIISEGQKNGVSVTCRKYNISRTLYYRWLKRYKSKGIDGLEDVKKNFIPLNKTSTDIEDALLNLLKEYPTYGPRALKYLFDELGYKISESAVYNIMKRNQLTRKEDRIRFAKQQDSKITSSIPPLTKLRSGECWLFWITDYGPYKDIGNIYDYTFYDLKSQIACTRLYNEVSLEHFENLLTATAMPVAQTLHMDIKYLCFFEDNNILKQLGKTFKSKINKLIAGNGFDFNIHILSRSNEDLPSIDALRKKYTQGCLSFLIPLIHTEMTFSQLKLEFQGYIRNYNLTDQSIFDHEGYTPVQYHNKLTHTKLILPMWAYIDRTY